MKPWNKHSSLWVPDFKDRPEQNFKLDEPKDLKNLPIELLYSVIGCSCFLGFILFLFSTAVIK
jgi:hypothetical protein